MVNNYIFGADQRVSCLVCWVGQWWSLLLDLRSLSWLEPFWSSADGRLFYLADNPKSSLRQRIVLRLSSVILGGVNICLVYRIGCKLKNCLTGLYAAIFFTGSVYCFVITGIFIMPDTPQLFFWLLSLMILIHVLPDRQLTARSRQLLLLLGLTIGLAMLSKYTSAYLWVAIGIFILFYNPKWLKTTELYVAILISAVMFLPVIYWNYKYNFISFTFHGERVNLFTSGVRPDLFLLNLPDKFYIIIR